MDRNLLGQQMVSTSCACDSRECYGSMTIEPDYDEHRHRAYSLSVYHCNSPRVSIILLSPDQLRSMVNDIETLLATYSAT